MVVAAAQDGAVPGRGCPDVPGLCNVPRSEWPRTMTDDHVGHVLTLTWETTPADATHWGTRTEPFQLSADPFCMEKVRDTVNSISIPPDQALVLCADQNSQIQTLDRTRPMWPLRSGLAEWRTHDYKCCGATSLWTALIRN